MLQVYHAPQYAVRAEQPTYALTGIGERGFRAILPRFVDDEGGPALQAMQQRLRQGFVEVLMVDATHLKSYTPEGLARWATAIIVHRNRIGMLSVAAQEFEARCFGRRLIRTHPLAWLETNAQDMILRVA